MPAHEPSWPQRRGLGATGYMTPDDRNRMTGADNEKITKTKTIMPGRRLQRSIVGFLKPAMHKA
jgi:hypothetical protein